MNIKVKQNSKTNITLTLEATEEQLKHAKEAVLKDMQPDVSAPGFRKGKAPLSVVEKQADQSFVQAQALDHALNDMFRAAVQEKNIRPINQPSVDVKSFVPYSELTAVYQVEVVPEIDLPDYTKLKVKREKVSVSKKDIEDVLQNLQRRLAEKKEVDRAAKKGDEVVMDFSGKDKDGKDVAGASGNDYPITLGSDTFIPGFEENLIGMKATDKKQFTVKFPSDYAHKPLANEKVTFDVEAKKIMQVKLPEIDDALAKKLGPFDNLEQARADIEKQLRLQKEQETSAQYRDALIQAVSEKTKFELPDVLIDEQVQSQMLDFKQNLMYRGMTLEEYLEQAGLSQEEYIEKEMKPAAERRVRAGLVLSEIANKEKIEVTPEEIEIRLQLMKGQYKSDEAMQQQLETNEARQNVYSQLMTEKTLNKLEAYAAA